MSDFDYEERGHAVLLADITNTVVTPDGDRTKSFDIDAEWWSISGTDIAIPFVTFDYENGRLLRKTVVNGRVSDTDADVSVDISLVRVGDLHVPIMDIRSLEEPVEEPAGELASKADKANDLRNLAWLVSVLLPLSIALLVLWVIAKGMA